MRMRRNSSLHLVPATIIAAGLVLTIKLGNIWQAYSDGTAGDLLSIASAEEKPEEAPVGQADAEGAPAESPAGEDAATKAALQEMAPGRQPEGEARLPYSGAELELLQKLASRREELEKRERELDVREGLLKAAEQQLEASSTELAALQQKIQGLIQQYDEQENKKLESLVTIYEKMKPKDAARIMNELDMTVLLDVMNRMKEAKAADILADMDPARAREVTTRLAERDSLASVERKS